MVYDDLPKTGAKRPWTRDDENNLSWWQEEVALSHRVVAQRDETIRALEQQLEEAKSLVAWSWPYYCRMTCERYSVGTPSAHERNCERMTRFLAKHQEAKP